jgi:hypothetical protein
MARLDKTLIDYLIIAISPALIMTLVGSLVFFLLDVFYKGNFGGRLEIIFALFVFAAVLVARIAIEESRERAALFAVPLAIVTLLAINKFVQFQGGVLQSLSFFINCGLIALVWWSANQLTWDCTMIDEDEEDSGEGLLEAVGLDEPGKAALHKEIAPVAEEQKTTAVPEKKPQSWWQRFLERRRRPHAPGVWVVYFSLAALPLFGIGQFFIPAGDQENRQYAFQLLCIYTASGLALLLATSFLGLRRYLRQRRQEMPLPIVNLWLGIGGALIVVAMLLALLLPRTNAEYDLSELAVRVGSPDQDSSQYGVGSEGVQENQPDAQSEKRDDEQSNATTKEQSDKTDKSQSDENGKEEKSQPNESNKSDNSPAEKSSADKSEPEKKPADQSSAEKKSQAESPQKSPPDDASSEKSSSEKTPQEKTPPEQSSAEKSTSEKSPTDKSPAEKTETKKPPAEKKQKEPPKSSGGSSAKQESSGKTQEKKQSGGQSQGNKIHPPAIPRLSSPAGIAWLLTLFKWIFYGVVAILVIYAIWRNREALWKAFCDFVQFLIDFWHNLFGGAGRRAEAAAAAASAKKILPRFADFTDPFAAGVANRYPPAELVRYTFNALEAWGRDRGCPRPPDQTPHEFVRCLAANAPALGDDAARLADLYSLVAYAPFTLPAGGAARLSQLWQIMRTEAVPTAVTRGLERQSP